MTGAQSFVASGASLAAVLDFVERRRCELRLGRELGFKLLLVVEELFLNVVQHGGPEAQAAPVTLDLSRDGGVVQLTLEDGGQAFNPFEHAQPAQHEQPLEQRPVGKLGVILVERFAERAEYCRADGRNRIQLSFSC